MVLEKAKIFKDFLISVNSDNTGVTFSMIDPVEVSVKNDNFATQVEIYDAAGTTDLFDFRYITFDGEAVFEITDAIKNREYTTIFVEYLSNIKFGSIDNNFCVDSVSAYTLQRLGLDINEFLRILGNNVVVSTEDITDIDNDAQEPFIFAVKLRFSEIPQNLNRYMDYDGTIKKDGTVGKNRGFFRNRVYVQSYNQRGQLPNSDNQFTQFDNAVTVMLPIPTRGKFGRYDMGVNVYKPNGGYSGKSFNLSTLIIALNELITDLTLSAEITVITGKSLIFMTTNNGGAQQDMIPLEIAYNAEAGTTNLNIRLTGAGSAGDPASPFLGSYLRFTEDSNNTNPNLNYYHAAFMLEGQTVGNPYSGCNGIWECYNFFNVYINGIQKRRALLSFGLLGNVIDISQLRNDYVLIQRRSQSLRVYVDYERNVYTDIQTTFEFAKSAYSNYEAYQKSNIDLTQSQQFETLKQQQKQARDLQTVDTTFAAINGVAGAAQGAGAGFAVGGPVGAIAGGLTSAAKSAAQIAQNEVKFNMQQQNQTANLKLAQQQQHESARATIVPTSELHGSLTFLDAFITILTGSQYEYGAALYTLRYIDLNDLQMAQVERYAFENFITDKVNAASQIVRPLWQTMRPIFQVKIQNKNPINQRKSFMIFAERLVSNTLYARNAVFGAGTKGLPNIDTNTGFVGNLSENVGASITFRFDAGQSPRIINYLNAYVTGRRQGARPFANGWTTYINDVAVQLLSDANVRQGHDATEWTVSYRVQLLNNRAPRVLLKAGINTIRFEVPQNVGTYDASNFDRILINTSAPITEV